MSYLDTNYKPCLLPWSHLYYFTDGYVYPCPSLAGNTNYRLGKTTDSIPDLWNSFNIRKIRIEMKDGKPPLDCSKKCDLCLNSCKTYFGYDMLDEIKPSIDSTDVNGYCEPNFIAWNILETNKCNLKCVYCNSQYSNQHSEDKAVASPFNNNLYTVYNTNSNVKEIWFASGEPVIQDSTYTILEQLIIQNKLDVRIRFITNLMITSYKGKQVYDLLEKFKDVIVFGSWDIDGKSGDTIREHSKSGTIKQNIRYIQTKNIKFYLQSVMSIYNLADYPDFHIRMFEEGILKKDNIRYYNLSYPEHYRYSILPEAQKQAIGLKLYDYKLWLTDAVDTFPNAEHPTITIDKIIECMMTGKWGHWGFSTDNNITHYHTFLKQQNKNLKRVHKT